MRREMLVADAFAEAPFAGNPAAVLILDEPLSDSLMQAVAAQNNLSETAFAVRQGAAWELRWFTPVQEAAFCGHATLATAHALATEHGVMGEIAFETRRVGTLRVRVEADGYTLDLPRLDPEVLDPVPAHLLALVPGAVQAFRNFENLFVELASEDEVRAYVPDLAAVATLHPLGLCVTAPGVEADFASRYFAPGAGIPEDPVTGSIHSTLVPWWAARLGRDELHAVQASARGGRLGCRLTADRILLTGRARTYLRGTIDLPD